jgi:TonB family protein
MKLFLFAISTFIFSSCYMAKPTVDTGTSSENKATVYSTFVIDKKGNVNNIKVVHVDCQGCPESVIQQMKDEAIEVIAKQPQWKDPGRDKNGNAIDVQYNLPIIFDKSKYFNQDSTLIDNQKYKFKSAESMYVREQMLIKYILTKFEYPDSAKKNDIEGDISVMFYINNNGDVNNINISKSPSENISDEIIKVLNEMPEWSAAFSNSDEINTTYDLQFMISLDLTTKKPDKLIIDKADIGEVNYNWGVQDYDKGNYIKAIQHYVIAIEHNPQDIDALYNCAACFIKLNNYSKCCYYLQKIKEQGSLDGDQLIRKHCIK